MERQLGPGHVQRHYLDDADDEERAYEERVCAGRGAVRLRYRDGRTVAAGGIGELRMVSHSASPPAARSGPSVGPDPAQRQRAAARPEWRQQVAETRKWLREARTLPRVVPLPPEWRLERGIEVLLTREARAQLAASEYGRGIEIGGPVFGFFEAGRLVVCDMPVAGVGTSSRMTIDVDFTERMQRRHLEATGWRLAGSWHVQPTWDGERAGDFSEPSNVDLRCWADWYLREADQELPVLANLIVSEPAHGGWMYPTIKAWLLDRGGDGELVAREARVKVEPGWER